ncbi:MAG TPA: hypothetical protein VFN04_06065 [Protaetiibacter sp.]|jgi:hypothetical protein|nr:hypothetical protein [Protaetiibacter sp.]
MSNNNFYPVPIPPVGDDDDGVDPEMKVGDEVTLDPDVDADQVNSAEADRLASGADDESGILGGDDPVGLT